VQMWVRLLTAMLPKKLIDTVDILYRAGNVRGLILETDLAFGGTTATGQRLTSQV
jgi:hypothetical protein